MKKLYTLLLCSVFVIFMLQSLFATTSEIPTVQEQLENLNKCWIDKNFDDKILKERILLNDEVQLIQTHLSLVEQKLRNSNSDNLSEEQKTNRLKCLDILNKYWTKGVFPKNIYHSKRTPYFIDHLGTACAVGQLIIETGYKDFAKKISVENNYGYIKELNEKYPEIKQWADKFGFTVSELAWIQPTYNICNVGCIQQAGAGFQTYWGKPPYTYLWNPTGQTTQTATGLCPGATYTCTVIDSLGDTVPNSVLQIGTQLSGLYLGNVVSFPAAQPLTFSQTITKCVGQGVTVGTHTYTVTGTYKDTLISHQVLLDTCDSVVTTRLTILYSPSATFSQTLTICGQSLAVGTDTYTTSGTYTYTFHGNGCDSTVNTNLTLLHKSIFSQTFTKCTGQSITVGTHTYTISGTYHDTLTAFNSCDSIITTHLIILPKNTFSQTITKCAGQSVTVGTHTYTVTGTYTDTLKAFNTCDSIVTTDLTILPIKYFSQTISKYTGQSITVGSHTYTVTGTYKDTLTAFNTCDSIVITHLTINPLPAVTAGSVYSCTSIKNPNINLSATINQDTIAFLDLDSDGTNDIRILLHNGHWPGPTDDGSNQTRFTILNDSFSLCTHTTVSYFYVDATLYNFGDTLCTGNNLWGTDSIYSAVYAGFGGASPDYGMGLQTQTKYIAYKKKSTQEIGWIKVSYNMYSDPATFSIGESLSLCSSSLITTDTISVLASPTNGGSVSGGGHYNPATTATVIANANACYVFTNLTEGGNIVSTNPSYSFAVTANRTLVANFSLLPVITFSQTITKCAGQSVTVGTHTYTVTGTYTDTLTSYQSCDSIVTTVLTVLPPNTFSQSITICAGRSLMIGSNTYATSGNYTAVLTAYNSCDSTVTTHLTVLPANTFSQWDTLWAGQKIIVGARTYTVSGTYIDTLTAANTCDSIVTTNLMVKDSNTFSQTIAKPDHVVILMLENYGFSKIIGNPIAPHINALVNDPHAALFTQSYALYHPSQPNYVMLYSGNNQGIIDDNQSPNTPFHTCNLGASLISKGYTFTGYSEGLPTVGDLTFVTGRYVRRHCPWTDWQAPSGINTLDSSVNQPYTSFPASANYNSLPTVSFVIPNLDHDMHDPIFTVANYQDTAISRGDRWVYDNLTDYINWAKTNNSLLILTFDEDEVISLTGEAVKSRIPTIFIGQMIKGGSYSNYIDHYTVLRTIEDIYALPYCDSSALPSPITGCWLPLSTGIEENTQNESVTIFPNPTSGIFQVQSSKLKVEGIKIFNILGEPINIVLQGGGQIDLSSQPSGVYFISIKTSGGIVNKKIIVSH